MPSAWRRLVTGLAVFLSSACGPIEVESGVPDGAEGRQWSDVWGTQDSTTVWLVVVDDAPTEQARELRGRLGEWLYPGDDECGGPNDPAHVESRTELTVLIGAAEPDRAQTTLGHPEWALEHPRSGDGAYERARQAVVETAAELETASTEPLRALDALESWRALLDGERAPQTDEEQRLVLQLPASYLVHALVLATRDDESEIARIGQTPARYSYWSFEAWLQVPECADVHGSRPQAL
ncbi:MAG TPA: hypothetical protein VLC09_00710, partial [Polyangiaceae bacterium]|nr:hypothetical protein [Polyangiaceae bacterium]